ncbi:tellurite resistance TerB family protein [uncultured Vibrio sp.]|uniref:tellurite resistance TerB family protein n=1 Tax=uncultured Vibrio sp. TaxID=114054 RepID=UPI0009231B89|nr:tellurite resistance TerB family protein [uncultured Vibrio sp.]OIQ26029.1 MAG: protein YebE [Vibrio sp. MedPE-SWchi]
MNLTSLLNQALKSDLVKQGSEKLSQHASSLNSKKSDSSQLKTLGAGAIGGGLVGALMGSKKTKKIGKKAVGIGGAAALGALAYKVYNDYQSKQGQTLNDEQARFDENDANHSILILRSMIAASKADGHVDEEEMAKIELAVENMGADYQITKLVSEELHKPLDPSEIAQLATSPQQASEIYLASLIVADEQNFMEKAYLKELAKQLNLADEVTYQLEQQVTR